MFCAHSTMQHHGSRQYGELRPPSVSKGAAAPSCNNTNSSSTLSLYPLPASWRPPQQHRTHTRT